MKTEPSILKELFDDIPRGVPDKRVSEQRVPQARFVLPKRVIGAKNIIYDPKKPGGKILLGAIGDDLIGIDDNRHIMTVAGSRSGKSVTIIGNLFFYPGSVLCTDPKGELAEKTAKKRADLGQDVHILDPFKIVDKELDKYQKRFNPLAILTLENKFIIEDALQIADALVVRSGHEKDPHWDESASHFIMGLALYVATSDDINSERKHLGTVRDCINHALQIIKVDENTNEFLLYQNVKKSCESLQTKGFKNLADVIMGSITGFYNKGRDERGSVLSTVHRHTQFLDFTSIRDILSGHDFDIGELKTNPKGLSVFLVLPATQLGICNRWLRLFVSQLMIKMERVKSQPKVPVMVCLDEFPVLGFMKQLQDAAGQIASFGVRLWVILQDWGQGKALYGERFESFAANAGILQAFGNVDVTTIEYLSRRLGLTVVEDSKISETSETQRQQGLSGEQTVRQIYPLMTPDEVSRTFARSDKYKRQLILWADSDPLILQRVEYFDKNSPLQAYL